MERYGADWTYDTLKRCRFCYQSYANASIGATPLPQLENHVETSDSKELANSGNAVATIQYFDFPFLQVPLAKLEKDGETFVQVPLAQITWYHHISLLPKVKSLPERAFLSPWL